MFRKLERDGLVLRVVDDSDRRNTWYSVSEAGASVANKFIDMFHGAVAEVFKNIGKEDENELINAFKSINTIFLKMESENA